MAQEPTRQGTGLAGFKNYVEDLEKHAHEVRLLVTNSMETQSEALGRIRELLSELISLYFDRSTPEERNGRPLVEVREEVASFGGPLQEFVSTCELIRGLFRRLSVRREQKEAFTSLETRRKAVLNSLRAWGKGDPNRVFILPDGHRAALPPHANPEAEPPLPDRKLPTQEVDAIPYHVLGVDEVYGDGDIPNSTLLKQHFLREGRLSEECIMRLLTDASKLLETEPNILQLSYPITVCGDIHGQYFDLMQLFEIGGQPEETKYLFLGDYVDRGCFSCEVVFLLLSYKIRRPQDFFMMRGNHESRQLTNFFNFRDECLYKYSQGVYDAIMNCFDHLPVCAVINNAFFCVHGGISPQISTLDEISALNRHQEIPREGPMCDLLWSDPYNADRDPQMTEEIGGLFGSCSESEADLSEADKGWFTPNLVRHCSVLYGVEAVRRFLRLNRLTSIIRAHEAKPKGYEMHMANEQSGIPRVITVFSAPNYCDVYNNKAACIKLDVNLLNIRQFNDSPHPFHLPNLMNVFEWSLPFVAEKVTDLFAKTIMMTEEEQQQQTVRERRPSVLERRGGTLQKKILAVSKLVRAFKTMRKHSEALVQLRQLTPSVKQSVPSGGKLLQSGSPSIRKALSSFENVKQADRRNMRMPRQSAVPAVGAVPVEGSDPPVEAGDGAEVVAAAKKKKKKKKVRKRSVGGGNVSPSGRRSRTGKRK